MGTSDPAALLLGAWHWGGSGGDYSDAQDGSPFVAGRREEIREVVSRLCRFQPTKVALEVQEHRLYLINQAYTRYRSGNGGLPSSETQQLGFRLAARLDIPKLNGIDWHSDEPIGWDVVIDSAISQGEGEKIQGILADVNTRTTEISSMLQSRSVAEVLQSLNSPMSIRREFATNSRPATIGVGQIVSGATVVARWFERNIRMATNVARLITSRRDRMLVIVGLARIPPILHILSGLESIIVVTAEQYLGVI